jgi:hypothetical protein
LRHFYAPAAPDLTRGKNKKICNSGSGSGSYPIILKANRLSKLTTGLDYFFFDVFWLKVLHMNGQRRNYYSLSTF